MNSVLDHPNNLKYLTSEYIMRQMASLPLVLLARFSIYVQIGSQFTKEKWGGGGGGEEEF